MVDFLNKYVCCFSKQKSTVQKKEQTVSNTNNKLDNVMVDDTRMSELDKKNHLQIDVDNINNSCCVVNENGSINGSINGSENNEGMCVSVLSNDSLTDDDSL
jgi:hypothetical protein